MIRNLAALAADFARHNSGILRARAAYAEQTAGVIRCPEGHLRHTGKRCPVCETARKREWRKRKAGQ